MELRTLGGMLRGWALSPPPQETLGLSLLFPTAVREGVQGGCGGSVHLLGSC